MTELKFQVGDIVTRDGTDRQRVLEIDDDLITVECIREPVTYEPGDAPWCLLGERETNVTRRYSWPEDATDGVAHQVASSTR
jgi:hypothetical protein